MAYTVHKHQEDPEVVMRRRFKAKCKFRACVRKVIENMYWLQEDEELYEGDNVKKRVEQVMRTKSKRAAKQLLTLTDKVLLTKPVEERTEAEKRYIYRKIGGLKCFKRYPNVKLRMRHANIIEIQQHVKRKLAAATYFRYYGPNRVIVRQNQEAHALYFVITGEVIVSVLIYDELLKQYVSTNVFVIHPGDMFGEVSLLHNIKRTATCTTSGHCEFLTLTTEDFKEILQKSLQKQWDEVTLAMNNFSYFDGLDEVARREGCIVAKMKSFDPDETILGDGVGISNHVYFVLSGRCQMIESLDISCKEISGKKYYTLIDPYRPVSKEELDIDKKYFNGRKTAISSSKDNRETTDSKKVIVNTENAAQAALKERQESVSMTMLKEQTSSTDMKKELSQNDKSASFSLRTCKDEESHEAIELSKVLFQARNDLNQFRKPFRTNTSKPAITDKNRRTYFMQVCIFDAGSTFGFGENMRDRRIVAMTRVDCMMLPLMWLLQKNTANIWSRIKHYLEKKIPTKKQLFNEFVLQRQWKDWQDSLVKDIVARTKTINYTTVHDVPYSIRMQEMLDM